MPAAWKVVVIGGEITVLAAFTGVGIHLAMQPHRQLHAPLPALLLPSATPSRAQKPVTNTPHPTTPQAMTTPGASGLAADWVRRLGRDDRSLVGAQWEVLQKLISGTERFLRQRVVPEMERKR